MEGVFTDISSKKQYSYPNLPVSGSAPLILTFISQASPFLRRNKTRASRGRLGWQSTHR